MVRGLVSGTRELKRASCLGGGGAGGAVTSFGFVATPLVSLVLSAWLLGALGTHVTLWVLAAPTFLSSGDPYSKIALCSFCPRVRGVW